MQVAIAASVASAFGNIMQGKAQDAQYQAQAMQALSQAHSNVIKSRQEELRYRDEGNAVLRNMANNLATVNARGAAGSINPFAGSTGNLMTNILSDGYLDFSINKDNAQLARENQTVIEKSAAHQAAIYLQAGKNKSV